MNTTTMGRALLPLVCLAAAVAFSRGSGPPARGAAETPSGWYHYVVTGPDSGRWEPGLRVTYQGPLFDLPAREVLSASGRPAGGYTVYFGVDSEVNGSPDLDAARFDSVSVTVE